TLSLNLAVRLAPAAGDDLPRLAIVQVPARLPRLVRVPATGTTAHVWLEDVVRAGVPALFQGQKVLEVAPCRITRAAQLELDDEGGGDYVGVLEEELRKRRRGDAVRLETDAGASEELVATLAALLDVDEQSIYRIAGPLDVRALMPLVELPGLATLRDRVLRPLPLVDLQETDDIFEVLQTRELLVHHPYESSDPVVEFVARAADDPGVLAIKQTLYRTSGDSPVVRALERAAEEGKQVTVLVELMARFDEQSNIRWARRLEEAGAHVIYGIRGFKTHAKICLVVRRGVRGIERYVHLGTGNYNDRTARLYTDFGLLTSDWETGADASAFFNALTGYSDPPRMEKLVMAPTRLRE